MSRLYFRWPNSVIGNIGSAGQCGSSRHVGGGGFLLDLDNYAPVYRDDVFPQPAILDDVVCTGTATVTNTAFSGHHLYYSWPNTVIGSTGSAGQSGSSRHLGDGLVFNLDNFTAIVDNEWLAATPPTNFVLVAGSGSFVVGSAPATLTTTTNYPTSATETNTALGFGNFNAGQSAGYLFQEDAGVLYPTFGGTQPLGDASTGGPGPALPQWAVPGLTPNFNDKALYLPQTTNVVVSTRPTDFDVNLASDLLIVLVLKHDAALNGQEVISKSGVSENWAIQHQGNSTAAALLLQDGASNWFANYTAIAGEWVVLVACVDRTAGNAVVAQYGQVTKAVTGTPLSISAMVSLANNGTLTLGTAGNPCSPTTFAGAYIATGPGAATNVSANAAQAALNFYNYLVGRMRAASGTFTATGTAAALKHGYVLSAGSGTFLETGTAATLKHNAVLTAGSGTFVLTGQPVTFADKMPVGSGAFVLTGTAATLKHNAVLTAGSGTFLETGTTATLEYGRRLAVASGTFLETGTAAKLEHGYVLVAGSGTFLETGTAVSLERTRVFPVASGTFLETGTPATLEHGYVLVTGSGTFIETGTAATLTYTPVGGVTLSAGSGAFVLTGTAATLEHGYVLGAGSGTFVATGTPATLEHGYVLSIGSGTFVATGTSATLEQGYVLGAGSGTFVATGTPATLEHGYILGAGSGTFSETGTAATFQYDRVFPVSAGTFLEIGVAATLKRGYLLAIGSGTFLETGTAATLKHGRWLGAAAGVFLETGTAATFQYGRVFPVSSGTFLETGTPANLVHGLTFAVASGSFLETGTAISFLLGRVVSAASGTFVFTGTAVSFLTTHKYGVHYEAAPRSGPGADAEPTAILDAAATKTTPPAGASAGDDVTGATAGTGSNSGAIVGT